MDIIDLIEPRLFAWRLQVLMAMADVRVCELADASGLSRQTVSTARSGVRPQNKIVRRKLMETMQGMHP